MCAFQHDWRFVTFLTFIYGEELLYAASIPVLLPSMMFRSRTVAPLCSSLIIPSRL